MIVLSRKVMLSVSRGVEALNRGQFDESVVKMLLYDLRELARAAPKIGLDDPKFASTFSDFVEICDFLAHSNRTKGLFERKIRQKAEEIAFAINSGDEDKFKAAMSFVPIVNIEQVVAGMLGTAALFLIKGLPDFSKNYLTAAFERREEIGLCILSLLQDTTIQLNDNAGRVIMNIISYDGRYRLYCRILGSRAQTDARIRAGGNGRLILGFPVIETSIKNLDGVLTDKTGSHSYEVEEQGLPPLIETYRNTEGRLAVREVS